MSEQEKHYIVHFTGARDDAPGIFPMVAYRNDEGKPIVIEPSEHEETFTYDEGFTYDVAKVYKRQTHGELEEVKKS